MASAGPFSPSTIVSTAGPFGAWSTPSNAGASDDSRTTCALGSGVSGTNPLDVTGYDDFNIPSDATINGIVVEIEKSCTSTSGSPNDATIQLIKGGTASGTNKASATTWPTTDAYSTYGGAADLWGLAWSPSDINASNFGVRIQAQKTGLKTSTTVRVDHVRITVYYTEGGGGPVLSATYFNRFVGGQ